MAAFQLIPLALNRRLILALLGFRCIDGRWWWGPAHLTEEQVDTMTHAQWTRYIARWVHSAGSN